jgi:hypothetical protein
MSNCRILKGGSSVIETIINSDVGRIRREVVLDYLNVQ